MELNFKAFYSNAFLDKHIDVKEVHIKTTNTYYLLKGVIY